MNFSPLELVSDNSGEFNSLLTSTIEKQYGYRHILITPYHPQSNGKCERVNQTVKAMLNKTIEENSSQWELCLPRCIFSYTLPSFLCIGEIQFYPMNTFLVKLQIHFLVHGASYIVPTKQKIVKIAKVKVAVTLFR